MSKRMFFLSVVAAMLLSLSAFAVDGVVLINQASVNAAGGFPYKITVSGSYKLSSNLVLAGTTDVIQVQADNVTIDLNGFSIIGPVTCTGVSPCSGPFFIGNGIQSTNNNMTLRNGTIQGMGRGVQSTGDATRIEEVTVTQCRFGGIFINSGIVRRNQVFSNGSNGIVITSGVVENNLVSFNAANGIGIN